MRGLLYFVVAWTLLSIHGDAQTNAVSSEKKWYRMLDKKPFSLAFFYQNNDQTDRYEIRTIKMSLAALNALPNYRQAGMQFLEVNIDRNDLENLADSFGITTVPAFLLFRYGTPIRNDQREVVMKTGYLTKREIQRFVDDYLGDDLDDRINQKRLDRLERERAQAQVYYGPYWYGWGGWPYNYGYPYYGPVFTDYGPSYNWGVGFYIGN